MYVCRTSLQQTNTYLYDNISLSLSIYMYIYIYTYTYIFGKYIEPPELATSWISKGDPFVSHGLLWSMDWHQRQWEPCWPRGPPSRGRTTRTTREHCPRSMGYQHHGSMAIPGTSTNSRGTHGRTRKESKEEVLAWPGETCTVSPTPGQWPLNSKMKETRWSWRTT